MTSPKLPNDSVIEKTIYGFNEKVRIKPKDYDPDEIRREVKARITNALCEKTSRINHDKLMKEHSKSGYILFISLGELEAQLFLNSLHYQTAISVLYGLGGLQFYLSKDLTLQGQGFAECSSFRKNRTDVEISNNYFQRQENKWVSAIIFSFIHPLRLLECATSFKNNKSVWNDSGKNDFILCHNPSATHPVSKNVLPVVSEIFIENENTLRNTGKKVLPGF